MESTMKSASRLRDTGRAIEPGRTPAGFGAMTEW
jgi:hypothetical protein